MRHGLVAIVSGILGLGLAVEAGAGPPTDQLRRYTDQVVKVLEDPALKGEEQRGERRAAVRKVATEIFDVEETARRALGRHWQARTPAEREEFVQLFADLLERTYIARIDQYGGERIKYVGESIDGANATVRARVVTREGTEIPVDARMLRKGERWLMFDVAIENVSLISNYRAQFDAIIRKSSYGDLVQRLKSKQHEFLKESPPKPRPSS
jgi:phospholipid transport system substrate-binding protein